MLPGSTHDDEARDVLAANTAFYAAFEALDEHAMAKAWSEHAPVSCIHPRGSLLEGRDAVLASWRSIFRATEKIQFALQGVRAFVSGVTAWVVLIETIESRQGGRVVRAATQATNVFVREAGSWKIVHHHAEPASLERPKKKGDGGGLLN
jgi:ketosteroid isomerase-like protein